MSIEELMAVVAPPERPEEAGTPDVWDRHQQSLGIRLPSDLIEFSRVYGTGVFRDEGFSIWVMNPASVGYCTDVEEELALLREARTDAEMSGHLERFPYRVHPERPGVFPCAADLNGNQLLWIVDGDPDTWRIAVRSPRGGDFEETHPGPLTSFLAAAFRREIRVSIWPESGSYFDDPSRLVFEPEPIPPQDTATYNNIYELYVENGNRGGFWVRKRGDREGGATLVKTIGGRREGPIEGIPDEHGRPEVIVDDYLGGRKVGSDISLRFGAYRQEWIRIESPFGNDQ
ncbi:MAG: hypothetical protein WD066_07535 [Planctomycetaceae bacterium]